MLPWGVCVCVGMHVWERKRMKKREKGGGGGGRNFWKKMSSYLKYRLCKVVDQLLSSCKKIAEMDYKQWDITITKMIH